MLKVNPIITHLFWVSFLCFFPSTITLQTAEAQGIKSRKGGLGRFFKRPPQPQRAPDPNSVAPEVVPEQKKQSPIPSDSKSIALKTYLMQVIPKDRHYREILADSIVIAYHSQRFKNLWKNHRQMPSDLPRLLAPHLVKHGIPGTMALGPEVISSRRIPVNYRDLGYTFAIADAALLVRLGGISPDAIWQNWNKGDRPGDDRINPKKIAQLILQTAQYPQFDPESAIDSMAPRNWLYRELQNGYAYSRRIHSLADQVPPIPDPATAGLARPGKAYAHAAALAENLSVKGYLDLPASDRKALQSVTPELAEALKNFQAANGLTADGIMGSGTWKVLSQNEANRYQTRTINLHRARLLPDELGERYVIVNLPSAELFGFEDGNHIMSMRIVHGKSEEPNTHTPVFRDIMHEVVFAPYWNVPESISTKEIYPKLLEDSTYLDRNRYEIVTRFTDDAEVYELNETTLEEIGTGKKWLRQKPATGNALGKVKFLLPNQFHIYLHDTPSKHFFNQYDRAQSHGCIRLASPPTMAIWTLKKQEQWNVERIAAAMSSDVQVKQKLDSPINVYITYFTEFPRPVGISTGEFALGPARDVYSKDSIDKEILADLIP